MALNAQAVYLTYLLPDQRRLVACWSWQRNYLSKALPERWEVVAAGEGSSLEADCQARGYRLIYALDPRKEEVWQQLLASQQSPQRSKRQKARQQAREARQRAEQERLAALRQQQQSQAQQMQAAFAQLQSAQAVKQLYRQLARQHHPDLGGSAELFQWLEQTYRVNLRRF